MAWANGIPTQAHAAVCPPPLIVLSPPRSFSSVISTMLGQHPDCYGIPETNLFAAETLGDWWRLRHRLPWRGAGLLRAVAQLEFGHESEATIGRARKWVLERAGWPTGAVFHALRMRVSPHVLVEASPRTSASPVFLRRLERWAPRARYLHLVRNSEDQSASLAKLLASPPPSEPSRAVQCVAALSGQVWLRHHRNITRLLDSVPHEQRLRLRGEDLLRDPDPQLRRIARWLELRCDGEAIEAMKHPERSPYACLGPAGARFGNDPSFLESPVLRPPRSRPGCARPRRRAPETPLAREIGALELELSHAFEDGPDPPSRNGRRLGAAI